MLSWMRKTVSPSPQKRLMKTRAKSKSSSSESSEDEVDIQEPNTPSANENDELHEDEGEEELEEEDVDVPVQAPVKKKRQTQVRGSRKPLTEDDVQDQDSFGFHVISSMTETELNSLLKNLEKQTSFSDTLTLVNRLKRINWEEVAFKSYSAEECKAAWMYLKNHCRKFRIMAEVLQEIKIQAVEDMDRFRSRIIENAPGFPKKPPSTPAYLFCKELWNSNPDRPKVNFLVFQRECLEGFQKLADSKQDDWKVKFDLAQKKYEEEVKEFYAKYPNYKQTKITPRPRVTKARQLRPRGEKATTGVKKPVGRPRTKELDENHKPYMSIHSLAEKYPDAPKLPVNPQMEYFQSKLDKLETPPDASTLADLKAKYNKKWLKLEERHQSKYVSRTISHIQTYVDELKEYKKKHPDYDPKKLNLKGYLKKSDLQVWAKFNEFPEKPPRTAVDSFYLEKLNTSPKYAKMTPEESHRLALEEYKNLDADEKELLRMNSKKLAIEYKRSLQRYFDWIPDIIKPKLLFLIPKKYQEAIKSRIPDLDAVEIENDEEHEFPLVDLDEDQEEDETLDKPPPPKKKKKAKSKAAHSDEEEPIQPKFEPASPPKAATKKKKKHKGDDDESDSESIIEYVDINKIINGRKPQSPTKYREDPLPKEGAVNVKQLKKALKMPKAEEFKVGRKATRIDIDELIRGIFDGRTELGFGYSVFYYYARNVCREKNWKEKLQDEGVYETARLMYFSFIRLSIYEKEKLLKTSWDWNMKTYRVRLAPLYRCPEEPVMPTRTPESAYGIDRRALQKFHKEKNISRKEWWDLDEEIQRLYIKKTYRDSKEYAREFQRYIANMGPQELVSYVKFQSMKWENKHLTPLEIETAPNRGFIHPLPKEPTSDDDICGDSEPEIIEDDEFRARMKNKHVYETPPSLLQNDDLLERITEIVTPDDPTIEELMSDSSSSDDDEDDSQAQVHEGKILDEFFEKKFSIDDWSGSQQ